MKKNFSHKSIFEMTPEEMSWTGYAEDLNINFIQKQLKKVRAAQYENYKDIIIFHPCTKDQDPYQVTYIWKKDNKPSGDIICKTLYQAAKEIDRLLNKQKEYYPQKVILQN